MRVPEAGAAATKSCGGTVSLGALPRLRCGVPTTCATLPSDAGRHPPCRVQPPRRSFRTGSPADRRHLSARSTAVPWRCLQRGDGLSPTSGVMPEPPPVLHRKGKSHGVETVMGMSRVAEPVEVSDRHLGWVRQTACLPRPRERVAARWHAFEAHRWCRWRSGRPCGQPGTRSNSVRSACSGMSRSRSPLGVLPAIHELGMSSSCALPLDPSTRLAPFRRVPGRTCSRR